MSLLIIIKPGDVIELRTTRHLRVGIDQKGIQELVSLAKTGEKMIVLSEISQIRDLSYLKVLHENKIGYIIWDLNLPFFKIDI